MGRGTRKHVVTAPVPLRSHGVSIQDSRVHRYTNAEYQRTYRVADPEQAHLPALQWQTIAENSGARKIKFMVLENQHGAGLVFSNEELPQMQAWAARLQDQLQTYLPQSQQQAFAPDFAVPLPSLDWQWSPGSPPSPAIQARLYMQDQMLEISPGEKFATSPISDRRSFRLPVAVWQQMAGDLVSHGDLPDWQPDPADQNLLRPTSAGNNLRQHMQRRR